MNEFSAPMGRALCVNGGRILRLYPPDKRPLLHLLTNILAPNYRLSLDGGAGCPLLGVRCQSQAASGWLYIAYGTDRRTRVDSREGRPGGEGSEALNQLAAGCLPAWG